MVGSRGGGARDRVRGGATGFTLVEVLVASLILATALLALSTLFALGLKNNSVAKEDTVMAALAQQQLESLRRIPSANLEQLLAVSCQGPCASKLLGDCPDCCNPASNGWDSLIVPPATRLCYPKDCAFAAAIGRTTEDPVVDPNPADQVRYKHYVRRTDVQKVNLGDPVGCIFKISVTVGSRNGLFAPPPVTDLSWGSADSDEVVGDHNPRRVVVSAFRR